VCPYLSSSELVDGLNRRDELVLFALSVGDRQSRDGRLERIMFFIVLLFLFSVRLRLG